MPFPYPFCAGSLSSKVNWSPMHLLRWIRRTLLWALCAHDMNSTRSVSDVRHRQTLKQRRFRWNKHTGIIQALRKCNYYTCECNLTWVHRFLYLTWDFDISFPPILLTVRRSGRECFNGTPFRTVPAHFDPWAYLFFRSLGVLNLSWADTDQILRRTWDRKLHLHRL